MSGINDFLTTHQPTQAHWLILAALMFSIGLCGLLTRRNAVGVLMAAELMLNAGALIFVIFNHFLAPERVDGQIMAIFIIAVAAAEAVIGMAIFVALFRNQGTVDVTKVDLLQQ